MLFTSAVFIVFFIAVVTIYFCVPIKLRKFVLLAANIVFYLSAGLSFFPSLAGVIAVSYVSGILIDKTENVKKRKVVIIGSVVLILGQLITFKYLDFFTSYLGILKNANFNSIIAPLGLSFYTLSAIGYLIDVYRKQIKPQQNIIDFSIFVSFFPQIISGPIPRASQLIPQFSQNNKYDFDQLRQGVFRMVFGAFKKIVIADNLSLITDRFFYAYFGADGTRLLISALLFSVQIYADFSSYSDMAIGAAKVLGIELTENFKRPYFAGSIREFWRRWHISLSSWFRDYLYIPLGGSRYSKFRRYVNVMIVFLVSGLWHGAALNFVFWGFLHGSFQIIGDITLPARKRIRKALKINESGYVYKLFSVFITFLLVTAAWVFFKAPSLSVGFEIIKKSLTFFQYEIPSYILWSLGLSETLMVVVLISILTMFLFDFFDRKENLIEGFFNKVPSAARWLVYYTILMIILIFGNFTASSFIYFQF